MSSLLAHASTGIALYLSEQQSHSSRRWMLPLLVALAALPDADYLALWYFDIVPRPRVTHSLLFCTSAGMLTWFCLRRLPLQVQPSAFVLFAAPLSHLLLDAACAHRLPLLWPLSNTGFFASSLPLFPGVIHAGLANPYVWRNLFIESGLLWPLLFLMVMLRRGIPFQGLTKKTWLLLPLWVGYLYWSLRLAGKFIA
jgi:inner membrane protein